MNQSNAQQPPFGQMSQDFGNRHATDFMNGNAVTVCFYLDKNKEGHIAFTGLGEAEFALVVESLKAYPDMIAFFRGAIAVADYFTHKENN